MIAPQAQLKEPDIQVLVERDRMEAFVIISASTNSRLATVDEVMVKLEAAGIRYGVNQESIKRVCQQPGPKLSVATGQHPKDGQDAQIVYTFNLDKNSKPAENENGSVDYKNINLFTTVSEGDILAEKIPAVPGKPGIDVLGNSIQPKPGRDLPLPIGKNVIAVEGKIIAGISGQVMFINNKVHVVPVIVINGDIDFSSGNIEFTGNVTVKGSVQPGFSIKAGGDIEVQGTVSGGIVEGRNITIRMGIQGMHRGHVKASQNVYAKFIENSNVFADGDVYVSDVILHSRVNAKHKVVVEGRRGIVGGQITAGEEIRSKVAGTQLAIVTELEVGVNPALREEYHNLRKDIHKVENTLDQTQKSLQVMRSVDQGSLTNEKRELLLKLTKAQFQLAGQAETMRNRIIQIEADLDQIRQGRIRIAEGVYPGVKIVVGTNVKSVRETLRFVTFYVDDGELKTSTYN
ncbi:hypothetical protein AXX12_03820 [Anaerosporomusa subterranea]|uniref:Flagellar Assembly Protein A N-terminal region domain-containing protein n=1 Tax=Anaerosporomusa subterranea TaxID=1794912 RepID=A0A154BUN7_ANASB|nr:hypothetical protein AXX12_03820 [Anaerosporomusa subterranea]